VSAQKRLETTKLVNQLMIPLDAFSIISDWYHYAILELLELENSSCEVDWITNKLSLEREIK
jgi:hypothetical protein